MIELLANVLFGLFVALIGVVIKIMGFLIIQLINIMRITGTWSIVIAIIIEEVLLKYHVMEKATTTYIIVDRGLFLVACLIATKISATNLVNKLKSNKERSNREL